MPKTSKCLLAVLLLLWPGLPACDNGSPTGTDWTARLALYPPDGAVLTEDFELSIGTDWVDSMVVYVDESRLAMVATRPFVCPMVLVAHAPGNHSLRVAVFAQGEQEELSADLLMCHGLGLKVGNFAPTFALPDLNGVTHSSTASAHTKAVLLDFWATWCPPCVSALPETQRLSEVYGSRGLKVLTIDDEEKATVEPFMALNDYTFTVLRDPDWHVAQLFGVSAIPTYFIIDHRGVVRYTRVGTGGTPLEDIIKTLL